MRSIIVFGLIVVAFCVAQSTAIARDHYFGKRLILVEKSDESVEEGSGELSTVPSKTAIDSVVRISDDGDQLDQFNATTPVDQANGTADIDQIDRETCIDEENQTISIDGPNRTISIGESNRTISIDQGNQTVSGVNISRISERADRNRSIDDDDTPMMRLRLTKLGLDYLQNVSAKSADESLSETNNDRQLFRLNSAEMIIGKAKVLQFQPPQYDYICKPPSTVVWTAVGGHLIVEGEWELILDCRPSSSSSCNETSSVTGVYQVLITDFNHTLISELNVDENGKFQLRLDSCQASVGQMNMTFYGNHDVTSAINAASETMVTWYQKQANQMLCAIGRTRLATVERMISEMMLTNVSHADIDYTVFGRPTIVDDCHLDVFFTTSNRSINDSDGRQLPGWTMNDQLALINDSDVSSPMFILLINQAMLNDLSTRMFQADKMHSIISNSTQPRLESILRTSCESGCLGSVSEPLAMFPNCTVEFEATATKPITFEITADGIVAFCNATVDVFVVCTEEQREMIVSVRVITEELYTFASIDVSVQSFLLEIEAFHLQTLNETDVDKIFHYATIDKEPLFRNVTTAIFIEAFSKLPVIEGLQLSEYNSRFHPGVVVLYGNVKVM